MRNRWDTCHKLLMNQRGTLGQNAPAIWGIIYGVTGYELGRIYGHPFAGAVVGFFIGFLSSLPLIAAVESKSDIVAGGVASLLLAPIYFFVSAQNRVWYLIALSLMRWVIFIIDRFIIERVWSQGSKGTRLIEHLGKILGGVVAVSFYVILGAIIVSYFRGNNPHPAALIIAFALYAVLVLALSIWAVVRGIDFFKNNWDLNPESTTAWQSHNQKEIIGRRWTQIFRILKNLKIFFLR
jgi:hypothetical protein